MHTPTSGRERRSCAASSEHRVNTRGYEYSGIQPNTVEYGGLCVISRASWNTRIRLPLLASQTWSAPTCRRDSPGVLLASHLASTCKRGERHSEGVCGAGPREGERWGEMGRCEERWGEFEVRGDGPLLSTHKLLHLARHCENRPALKFEKASERAQSRCGSEKRCSPAGQSP